MKETLLDFDFLILNRIPTLYSARRFQSEIIRLKRRGRLISPEDLDTQLYQNKALLVDRPALGPPILYRQGDYNFWPTHVRLTTLNQKIINNPPAFLKARDKWLTYQSWRDLNIPMPKTFLAIDLLPALKESESLFKILEHNLKLPFIIKKRFSSQGRGVFLINQQDDLKNILLKDADDFRSSHDLEINYFRSELVAKSLAFNLNFLFMQRWLFQECIPECLGQDIRNFYIDGDNLAIERKNNDSFLSNLHQGGVAAPTKLSSTELEFCQKIHQASSLNYSGVDFLRTKRGPLFLEINPSPGFEGIEKNYSINIANKLIQLIE